MVASPEERRTAVRRHRLALLAVPLLLLAACGDDDSGGQVPEVPSFASTTAVSGATTAAGAATTAAGGATTAAPGGGSTITVQDFAFNPRDLTVKAGTDVEIKNEDGTQHTFTADDGAFDLELDPGGGASYTPDTPGTFAYHCAIHTQMKGTLTVS
jgi:plastocyanin